MFDLVGPVADPRIYRAADDWMSCSDPALVAFPWGEFDTTQFQQLVRLCAGEQPVKVLAAWEQVARKLQDIPHKVSRLQDEVLERVTSIRRVDLCLLERAPLAIRSAVLESINSLGACAKQFDDSWWTQQVPALELLLNVMYDLTFDDAVAFFDNIRWKFEDVDPVLYYRTVHSYISLYGQTAERAQLSLWLCERAEARLGANGYVLGVIKTGTHRGAIQHQVDYNGVRYVQDRRSHRYSPRRDDLVIFRPESRVHLTPKVAAVFFYPVW